MTIDVALCGDRRVIWGLVVAGRSALEHASEKVNFWIICLGYSEGDMASIRESWAHERLGTITFCNLEAERLRNFRSTMYLKSKAAYARYYIADLFPSLSRCIYLDTDLMIFRDLAEAMHIDLGEKGIAAVRDVSIRVAKTKSGVGERLGLRDEQSYFNSGFLVIDLDYWRAHDITKKIIELSIREADILDVLDQDALNLIFEDQTFYLDATWNVSQYEKPDPVEGKIVHLIGSVKPWHSRYKKKFGEIYYLNTIYSNFYSFLDRTEFKRRRPFDLFGLGGVYEGVAAKIPTTEMISRKVRLLLGK